MSNAKLQKFMQDMEKKFGKNVVRIASDVTAEKMYRVPTGSIGLDIAIGGGYPVGRFIQISGAFSSTKSTTTYHGMKNFQKFFKENFPDLKVALIQAENGSWTDEYGRSIGIDTDDLLFNECASMEEALEIARQLQERGIAGLIVFDSFEALEPMKEMDSSMEDAVQMGLKPKMFGEYFRKFQAINNKLSREGKLPCTVIGINQLREKIGAYGDPEYEGGGRAIGFASSLTIRLRRGDWITVGTGANKAIIGQQVKYKINKSKVSVPQKSGMWDVYLDEGGAVPQGHIDNFKEIIIEAVAYGVIHKGGAWISYGDMKDNGGKPIQGADAFVEYLRDKPELFEEIRKELMSVALENAEEELEDFKGSLSEEDKHNLEVYGTTDPEEIAKMESGEGAEDKEVVVPVKTPRSKKGKKQ
jgi:recombination protein RecA